MIIKHSYVKDEELNPIRHMGISSEDDDEDEEEEVVKILTIQAKVNNNLLIIWCLVMYSCIKHQ